MVSAGVYARISSDPGGTRLGVERQLADCRVLADRLGWSVPGEYVDNDVSAWSGSARPEYRRMLDDLKSGLIDGVLVWHPDRLHRHPRELEELIELVEGLGNVQIETVTAGDYDLSTSTGRSIARIVGAIARKDSDDSSVRLRRKHAELAAQGKLSGGGPRPFGYAEDRVTLNPSEAAVVREMARRVLAGDSLRSICADLNARGVRTSQGNEWDSTGLRRVLMSARISGRREHGGEFFDAQWPGIISPEDSGRLRLLLGSRTRSIGRPPRTYLLTGGLLRCGRCGAPMVGRARADGTRRYVCAKGPGQSGCGRMSATADPLEHLITEAVLHRLDTPELAAALLDARRQHEEASDLQAQLEAEEALLEQIAADYANRAIGRREWLAARQPLQARIDTARRRLSRLSPTTVIDDYVGHADVLRAAWDSLGLSRQQAVVQVVLDHVIAHPATPGRRFDPDRFEPIWNL
jgi:site-specific DNA recombinase